MIGCLLLPVKLVLVILKIAVFLVLFAISLALLPLLVVAGLLMFLKAVF